MKILLSVLIALTIIFSNLLVLTYSISYPVTDNYRTKEIIGYFRGKNNLEDNFFSDQAKRHLSDVKNLLNTLELTNHVLLAGIIVLVICFKKKPKQILESGFNGSLIAFTLLILTALISFVSFDFFFIKFHEVIFRNDDWLFHPNDNLIKLFPTEFFINFTRQLILNILLSILAIMVTVKFINVRTNN